MAYKKLIKVSNVCQLLDKSLYFETKTVDGITYTNNGDGTITINGTNTKESVVTITTNYKLHKSHFYIKRGRFSINWGYDIQTKDDFSLYRVSNDINNGAYYYLPVGTYDNVVDKPQLFDLTEMYGAGNEPTTVEQFRQDFPEEMYDYSPYCWLTSYKRVIVTGNETNPTLTSYQRNLTCKTKNLFDIGKAVKVSGVSSLSIDGKYLTVSHRADYSYISANVLLDTSLVGKTVTLSAYAKTSDKNTAYLRIQWLSSYGLASKNLIESNNVSGQTYQKLTLTGVIPEQPDDAHNFLCLSFYSNGSNVVLPSQLYTVIYTDIQLELGSTATDYVPYGHL